MTASAAKILLRCHHPLMSTQDSTATEALRRGGRAVALVLIALILLAVHQPGLARADGDPASDVLAAQSVFIPADGGIPAGQQSQLTALATAINHRVAPLRVALIATPADLGSVTALWRQPQAYARFLGEELSLVFRGTLLVAMPNGFGVQSVGPPMSAAHLTQLPPPEAGHGLGAATMAAMTKLFGSGHQLPVIATASRSATGGSALGSVDPGSWLALAAGAVLIALAWSASLRARPTRRQAASRAPSG
jgi:hypothetical protein